MQIKWVAALCLLSGLHAQPALAVNGFSAGSQQATEVAVFAPEAVVSFAKRLETTLAEKGARVAIVARVGRPPSEMPQGMHFTHVAFAVYSQISLPDGRRLPGYAMYNLYQKEGQPDRSELVQDFPADFFAGVAALEAGVIVPSPELQRRLLATIASPSYARLHDPHYSVIANPYNLGRQNCTEFVLDVVHAAIYQTDSLERIKSAEQAYFKAQPVQVNPFKLLLGSWFTAEVSMSDQPTQPPVTATFEKLAEYLQRYDQGAEVLQLQADGPRSTHGQQ